MVLGWQDWNLLRRSDGTLVFRALWKLQNGSELDLSWRQLSLPTAGTIQGFAPLSQNASDAARFSDDGFGPECTSFRGLGLSSEPDTCVLDGSGVDACHFSCIGAISPYVDPASSQGRPSIPGPFTLLTSALTLWIMEGSTSFAQQGGGTPVQEVSANMTLEVENPNAFVANPSMRLAIVLTLSPLLAVPSDWISLDLGIETRSRRLPQNSGRELRELQLASLVRVGVTVAIQSSASSKPVATEAAQGTQSTQNVVTSLTMAQNLQSLAPNQVATGISQNAQQISGQPVVVKVQEISPPQVSKVNSGNSISTSSPAGSQDQRGNRGTIGVVRKGGCSGQGSVALAATASLFSLSLHFRSL